MQNAISYNIIYTCNIQPRLVWEHLSHY